MKQTKMRFIKVLRNLHMFTQ